MQNKKSKITLDSLKAGFDKFFTEYGHYPSVVELDDYPYLPSSRQIQRIFKGGVKELRKLLGVEIIDFRVGESRSTTAKNIGQRGLLHEIELQEGSGGKIWRNLRP